MTAMALAVALALAMAMAMAKKRIKKPRMWGYGRGLLAAEEQKL